MMEMERSAPVPPDLEAVVQQAEGQSPEQLGVSSATLAYLRARAERARKAGAISIERAASAPFPGNQPLMPENWPPYPEEER